MTDYNKFLNEYKLKDPVCLWKWTWSTIRLMEGTTNSCHRVKSDKLSSDTYKDFHNTPTKLQHREKMQKGIWPGDGCEYCKNIEDSGGLSDRKEVNSDTFFAPVELKENPNAVNLTPKIVEVYFNNLCNLNCIYCSGKYSTLWEAEENKFGLKNNSKLQEAKKQYPQMLEKHWEWMKENAVNIAEYRILGGEPFFQPELEENIKFFLNNPCPNTKFIIFSNLKIKNDRMRKLLDKVIELKKINHIAGFKIVCSFDCWGAEQEYIRTGLNLNQWEENFLTLLHDYPSIDMHIHGTLISLTMQTLPMLCEKIAQWNNIRHITHTINFVNNQPYMDVGIFPNGFFDNEFNKCIELHNDSKTIQFLQGYKDKINNQKYDPNKIKKLKTTLDDIDKRRGTNWKTLWPWLDNYEV